MTATAVSLCWQEGVALDVLDLLLGTSRRLRLQGYAASAVFGRGQPPDRATSPLFLATARERVVRRCLWTLVHRGGWREQSVLRGGVRHTGRFFDASLNRDLDLRFGPLTDPFLERVLPHLPELARASLKGRKAQGRRVGRRWLKNTLSATDAPPGDWLFLGLVQIHLRDLSLPPEAAEALAARLSGVSPLARLLRLDDLPGAVPLEALLQPSAVRLVECLDPLLARHWQRRLEAVWTSRLEPTALAQRFSAIARVLRRWLELLDAHQRLDRLPAVLIALQGFVGGLQRSGEVRDRVRRRGRTAREGDRLAHALAEVVDRVEQIASLQRQVASTRYGDERYEEAQLCLERMQGAWDRAIDAPQIASSLRGRIG